MDHLFRSFWEILDDVTDTGAACYSLEKEGCGGGSGNAKPLENDKAEEGGMLVLPSSMGIQRE